MHWPVSPKLVKFLIAGGISYLVNQLSLVVLDERALGFISEASRTPWGAFNERLLVASVVAVEISIVLRFVINDRWTFKGGMRQPFVQRFSRFNVSSFGSPLLSLAAVNTLTPLFGMNYLIANSIGVALGLALNWFCSVRFVWVSGAARRSA